MAYIYNEFLFLEMNCQGYMIENNSRLEKVFPCCTNNFTTLSIFKSYRIENYHLIYIIWHSLEVYVVIIARCRVQYGKYFPSFSYFATYYNSKIWITAKYEKRGKYLPILQEAMCDNYFIVKCLFKPNVLRVIILTNCIGLV